MSFREILERVLSLRGRDIESFGWEMLLNEVGAYDNLAAECQSPKGCTFRKMALVRLFAS